MRGICGGAPERGRPYSVMHQPLSHVLYALRIPEGSHAADTVVSRTIVASTLCRGRDETCGVHLGSDVGEIKRRGSLNFSVGRKSSLFATLLVAKACNVITSTHDEEVKDHRYTL